MADRTSNAGVRPRTERDLAALAHSDREPGPQHSKASTRAHRITDRLAIVGAAVAVLAFLAGPLLALFNATGG